MNRVLAELSAVVAQIDEPAVTRACEMIRDARNIMLYGCGREGLQMQGMAMRLHHLGLSVSMQGDMAAPPMAQGDLFITSAGPGHLATVQALMGQAKTGGADVVFITGTPSGRSAAQADHTLTIPAQTMANDTAQGGSATPMGSLFESAMGVMFDAMILQLMPMLGETPDTLRARHTNME